MSYIFWYGSFDDVYFVVYLRIQLRQEFLSREIGMDPTHFAVSDTIDLTLQLVMRCGVLISLSGCDGIWRGSFTVAGDGERRQCHCW